MPYTSQHQLHLHVVAGVRESTLAWKENPKRCLSLDDAETRLRTIAHGGVIKLYHATCVKFAKGIVDTGLRNSPGGWWGKGKYMCESPAQALVKIGWPRVWHKEPEFTTQTTVVLEFEVPIDPDRLEILDYLWKATAAVRDETPEGAIEKGYDVRLVLSPDGDTTCPGEWIVWIETDTPARFARAREANIGVFEWESVSESELVEATPPAAVRAPAPGRSANSPARRRL